MLNLFGLVLIVSIVLTACLLCILFFLVCKKRKGELKHKMDLPFIFVFSGISFFFSLAIVFLTVAPSVTWLQTVLPEAITISGSTEFWSGTWLSILSIVISVATAVVATLISRKQDDLVQFEFESSLTPVLLTDGFKSEFVSKAEMRTNNIYKNAHNISLKDFEPNGGLFILQFSLKNEINPSIKYILEDFNIYRGVYNIETIEDAVSILSQDDKICHETIKKIYQRDGCVLELRFCVKDRTKFKESFNMFLINLENAIINHLHSSYTIYLKMKIDSENPRYNDDKHMIMTICIVNEASLIVDSNVENRFKVYSTDAQIR
jgi:hypothetical protein